MSELLKVSNLTVKYKLGNSEITAVDDLSLKIPMDKGYSLGIVGESGSGKSTLGMSILGVIERPGKITGGQIEFEGQDVLHMSQAELRKFRWEQVSMIYQAAMNSLNPVKPISHPITEVLRHHKGLGGSAARDEASKLLIEVGFPENRIDDYPHELSGGMKQRVVIALALALSPKLLIADEPTSALDVVIQKDILSVLVEQARKSGLSLIYITHEISILPEIVRNVAVMYHGEIVEMGPVRQVLRNPLHPYTEMLLSTLLTMESGPEVLERYAEEPFASSAALPLEACTYSNRCKYVFNRCHKDRPRLIEVQNGRWVSCHRA
ncbi:MAG: ABC transporter ATP-binding protein [Thaumarchaeota archaeon]|nr:ABC transporter ATP-binding protein [Nitrososphaerota archaeon]